MDKLVFKGIKQATMDTYQSATNKKGYLWFVRETIQKQEGSQSPFEENRYHIYFGDKKYGDFWGGLYESIGALVEAINQQAIVISNKQEVINDLEVIRSGAALGATALQEVPSEYVTESELNEREYATLSYTDQELSKKANDEHEHNDIYYTKEYVDSAVQKLITNTNLSFFCIEPVSVRINSDVTDYPANTLVNTMLMDTDDFEIITTSDISINALYAWPKSLNYYYPWLEGVNVFNNILFDMNSEEMYTKWNQGNQGLYHVQFAQYKNCIFWSDLSYISDVAKRTNYTLYYSSELPLCYSTIPDNTFKSFYFAYNVTCDPNWSNPAYKESFAKATWATQVFSYYGLHSIGLFDMDSTRFNITLPKDCRGLMFYAPNILNAGVFDAINVTNFGAKSGSWRDAFAYCYQLTNLYIKNLKVNLNVSWSPINQQSLEFILSNAANTNKITIYLSPHTYYGLTDANKTLATEKNITLSLIETNTSEDARMHMLQMTGDGNSYLTNDGTYKTITIPEIPSLDEYVTDSELESKGFVNSEYVIESLKSKSDTGHTHDEKYYTKTEVDSLLETIKELIKSATNKIDGGIIKNEDTPIVNSIGEITENNEIVINEEILSAGTYTLKYLDGNDNIVDNTKPITNFTI